MAHKSHKYYAVRKGRQTGIFTNWQDCKAQVHQFPHAEYKSFATQSEAEAFLRRPAPAPVPLKINQITNLVSADAPVVPFVADSICVDASCRGNPGKMEYRGVHTGSGVEIFHSPVFPVGTNNLGEFLAIVHGLTYLQQRGSAIPIYSDSRTALLWVARKQVHTNLPRHAPTEAIWQCIDRALRWLNSHTYPNPLYKWDTAVWGEIPADFGRK
jgi:ribonuclease HI